MTNQNEEELITINKSDIKSFLSKVIAKLISYYIALNKETTLFWRRLFNGDSKIRILLESEAIVLFFNTVAMAIIGTIFGGLINQILSITALLNILTFLIIKMDWLDKLIKNLAQNNKK